MSFKWLLAMGALSLQGSSSPWVEGDACPLLPSHLEVLSRALPLWSDAVVVPPDTAAVADSSLREALVQYEKFYGLPTGGLISRAGKVQVSDYEVAVHTLEPPGPVGTAVVVHGYLEHGAINIRVIQELLEQSFAVVFFDLPGHGLSSGERGGIRDFSDYGETLAAVLKATRYLPAPWIGVGHSTGCAVFLEGLRGSSHPFDALFFAAPLVRSAHYPLTSLATRLLFFIPHFPRTPPRSSSDEAYLTFLRHYDPLQTWVISRSWVMAHQRWERALSNYPQQGIPLTIVQGDRDGVVDWQYNLPWLEGHFSQVAEVRLHGAQHSLFNEGLPYRTQVLQALTTALPR